MEQIFTRTQEIARSRIVPFTGHNIAATASGSADTFATVANAAMLVKRLVAVNITGAAATLSVHAVPEGGAIGDDNAQLVGFSIDANTAVDLTDLIGGYYASGATLEVWSDTADAVTLSGYYEDVF